LPRVGNDIVDLSEPSNRGRSRSSRFLNRVFDGEEQRVIRQAPEPDTMLWALWAAKEAAYKLASKLRPGVNAIPHRYAVVLGTPEIAAAMRKRERGGACLTGRVATPDGGLEVDVEITAAYVHCLAARTPAERLLVRHRVFSLPADADPSTALRQRAVPLLARLLDCNPDDLGIRRFPAPGGLGPPIVFLAGVPAPVDLSLSHDGRFGAVAVAFTTPAPACA
jgi:phosphopantetheinyl transferase (holo-ACP synthase)